MRLTRVMMAVVPLVAVGTVALGLRLGASGRARAARVRGAAPSEGRGALAWQIEVSDEDVGVGEPVEGLPVEVHASVLVGGGEHTSAVWRGTTDAQGIAEADLVLDARPGDAIALEVRGAGSSEPLVSGVARVPARRADAAAALRFAPPVAREGDIVFDVAVLGERVAASGPSLVLVATGEAAAEVTLEPGDGLAGGGHAPTCANGWAALEVRAEAHVAVARVRVRAGGREGAWSGALPVAAGAAVPSLPLALAARTPADLEVAAPPARRTPVYAEIDDAAGRAWGAIAQVADGRARLALPALAPGRYWLVTAADARAAETFAPGTLARPFEVVERAPPSVASGAPPSAAVCALFPALAEAGARSFPTEALLDGRDAVRAAQGALRARGRAVALGGLALGAIVEALFVVSAARGPKGARTLVTLAYAGLALLGFAMIAALVAYGTR